MLEDQQDRHCLVRAAFGCDALIHRTNVFTRALAQQAQVAAMQPSDTAESSTRVDVVEANVAPIQLLGREHLNTELVERAPLHRTVVQRRICEDAQRVLLAFVRKHHVTLAHLDVLVRHTLRNVTGGEQRRTFLEGRHV